MLKTQIKYTGPMKLKVKGFNKALKDALTAALAYWHRTFLPQHFQTNAYYRYPGLIKKRRGIVENGKLLTPAEIHKRLNSKDISNTPLRSPMLVSGTLMHNATRQIVVTGSTKTLRGRLPGTQVANFFPRANAPYNMREEMTAVNEAEERQMDLIVDEEMEKFLNPSGEDPYETFQVT